MAKRKAYMICVRKDDYPGDVAGHIVDENSYILGCHVSSSTSFLRHDLSSKVSEAEYEIIDLIDKPVPEHLQAHHHKWVTD